MHGKILIYGGSGGIGAATARLLHARGHALHLVGRNGEALQRIAAELGADCTVGDVLDADLHTRAAAAAGALEGLIYAVGTINLGGLARLKAADFLADFQVNAMGAALAVQSALPGLRQAGTRASVVLFSSVAARQGFAMHASMSMAKGAIDGLTLALAAELAPKIRVNAIAPSLTRTPLSSKLLSNEPVAAGIAAMHALGRLGTPEDIAALAAFLVGPESDWMTGQIIGLDGGRSSLRNKG